MADDALAKIEPQVLSKADPESADLLQARADVQSHPHIQALFREGLAPDDLAERLAGELRLIWAGRDPTAAAQFLADEYAQVGQGILLVSTRTGRIAKVLQPEDLYQPAMVPREGGGMATPLQRIRPELEAAIVTWFHDKDREQRALEILAERGHPTPLLRDLGDPRLLAATRRGRQHIVDSLAKFDPRALLEAAGGSAGAFLRLFEFSEPGNEMGVYTYIKGKVTSKSVMMVQDSLTVNLHHNRAATLRGALVQGWVREIAKAISIEALHGRGIQGIIDVRSCSSLPANFWVGPPEVVRPFHRIAPRVAVLPVEHSQTLAIDSGPLLGYLKVPKEFETLNLEVFDRWHASAVLDFEVWVDLSKVQPFTVEGLELEVQVL